MAAMIRHRHKKSKPKGDGTLTFSVLAELKAFGPVLKKNWRVMLAILLFSYVADIWQVIVNPGTSFLTIPVLEMQSVGVGYKIINGVFGILGYYYMYLFFTQITGGHPFGFGHFRQLFSIKVFFKFLVVLVIVAVLTFLGFLLLIAPGFWVMIILSFASFLVVDGKSGVFRSLRESKNMVNGRFWKVFGVGIRALLIIFIFVGPVFYFVFSENVIVGHAANAVASLAIFSRDLHLGCALSEVGGDCKIGVARYARSPIG